MKLNSGHIEFREKFALAALETATNPHAPNRELTGTYSALREEFKRVGWDRSLPTLTRMRRSKIEGGYGRLVVSDDIWSFTADGLKEYDSFLNDARKRPRE